MTTTVQQLLITLYHGREAPREQHGTAGFVFAGEGGCPIGGIRHGCSSEIVHDDDDGDRQWGREHSGIDLVLRDFPSTGGMAVREETEYRRPFEISRLSDHGPWGVFQAPILSIHGSAYMTRPPSSRTKQAQYEGLPSKSKGRTSLGSKAADPDLMIAD